MRGQEKLMGLHPRKPLRRLPATTLLIVCMTGMALAQVKNVEPQTEFKVKYVANGAVYLSGGSSSGLAPGHRLTVLRKNPDDPKAAKKDVAELKVLSVASTSSVCEVQDGGELVRPGDIAVLSPGDAIKIKESRESKESKKYAQVVSFSEGDPPEEELRESLPRPPSPAVNRIRGRIGLEFGGISDRLNPGAGFTQYGLVMKIDMTRLGGTYWNLRGYYRGRFDARGTGADQPTLTELVNRTYHLSLTYENPGSRWVAGFGRFLLPWATSLDTIDGGYVGRRLNKTTTVGVFGGSAPDPTSWNYAPNRQMAGAFTNFEGGTYESFRYTSTIGMAVTRVDWRPDRQFAFFENGFFWKQYLSVYDNLEVDLLRPSVQSAESGPTLSRSFLTVRFQPVRFLSFDLSDNYFRSIPTFDLRLISTGLVDKLLFQGLSGGVRVELPYRLGVYASLGKSSQTGDARDSLNEMYGLTLGQIWRTGIRADVHYSKFNSSFGSGTYRSVTFARDLGERLHFTVEGGDQNIVSTFTSLGSARWISSTLDWFLLRSYFLGSGFTLYRGNTQSYDQWYLLLGYRF